MSEQITLESLTEWQDVEPNQFLDPIFEYEPSKRVNGWSSTHFLGSYAMIRAIRDRLPKHQKDES